MHELKREDGSTVSSKTITDWGNFFRDLCTEYFIKNPVQIGGENKIVEIDETVLVRRKYNRGRVVDEQWIFGGVEREGDVSWKW